MKLRRVFALAPDCHVAGWRYGPVWHRHFYEGLEDAGLEVTRPHGVAFDWARPVRRGGRNNAADRRATSRELVRQIRRAMEAGLDAVISYCFAGDLELGAVDEVREAGVPWINFFCDSMYAFDTVEPLARRTTLNWFVERAAETSYAALGVPYLCAPYALNPRALPDASCRAAERALAFVGTAHRNRIRQVTTLRLLGVDLHVAGWRWREAIAPRRGAGSGIRSTVGNAMRLVARHALHGRVRGHLEHAEFLDWLRGSQTLLGLNEGGTGSGPYVGYLKLRDVEFPGFGCCYLTQHNDDVASVFDVGREIRTFRNLWEARQIARELARDPEGCLRMGRRARERVLAEHSWNARLRQLGEAL